ncbi:DUF862-domain-containing protein [Aureobasidium sp. EXF-10727]|nr:DUF862-domain-containing protein [Aureobasidium sp. EXF-10727]
MTPSSSKHKRQSSSVHRASLPAQKTEVKIHVYDLLPPGRLSNLLWHIGGSLLHSGVVINEREYAYGGHDRKGVSGVYWTKPKLEPPGGTFRCEIVHGFSVLSQQEITDIINDASRVFQGTRYNLLSNNCNHFSSYLCERLTGRPGPAWLNRAASVGLALPCVVPKEWITPPDHETADGELIDEEEEHDDDETAAMLPLDKRTKRDKVSNKRITSRDKTPPPRPVSVKDTSGREMPASERAPMPKR